MCRAAEAPTLGAPWTRSEGCSRDSPSRCDEDVGAIATEYGLTLLLIALAIILAATAFGLAVAGLFDRATVVIPVSGS